MKRPKFHTVLTRPSTVVVGCILLVAMAIGHGFTTPTFAQTSDPETQVRVWVETAGRYIDRARYDRAIERLDRAAAVAGIPKADQLEPDRLYPIVQTSLAAEVLLQRGIAHEGLGLFVEARNDYLGFLVLAPDHASVERVESRMRFVDDAATRYLGRLALQGEADLTRFFNADRDEYALAVVPFFNTSRDPSLVRAGYGVAGFLSNVLVLLDHFTDRPFQVVERTRLDAALSEISIDRFYSPTDRSVGPNLGRIVGASFVISGTLDTLDTRLFSETLLTEVARDSTLSLPSETASYSNSGLQQMQENLVFKIADALQVQTGFRYVPSRSAFVDSVRTLLVDDIQRFLTYGEGLELALSGAYDDADRVLSDANLSIARRDQSVIEQMRLEIQQGRTFQNPLSLREATRQSEIQLEAALNELTQSTLGTFGVNLDMTGSLPLSGSPVISNGQPPNDTIPGSQDPSQLPIQVVRVILPPPPVND